MKKLLLLSLLSIAGCSQGMELPKPAHQADNGIVSSIEKIQKIKDLHKSVVALKHRSEIEPFLKSYYENAATSPLLEERTISRTIKDILRAKFPGITVCDLYPFYSIRTYEQEDRLKRLDTMVHPDSSIGTHTAQDLEQIKKIFNENYRNLLVYPNGVDLENEFIHAIQYNSTLTVIRNEQNQVVGFATYKFSDPDIWALHVEMLGIDKQYQKQGYGRRLIQYLADLGKAQGFSRLTLSSAPASVGFYKKMGFTQTVLRICSIPVLNCRIGEHPLLEKDIN